MNVRFVGIGCFCGLVWISLAPLLHADTQTLGALPLKPRAAGLSVNISLETVAGNGYHPVHLVVNPTGQKFTRDRRLGIVVTPKHQQQTDLDFRFRTEITVPQSATSFKTTLLVPHYFPWDSVEFSLSEDGVPIETGRRDFALSGNLRVRDTDQTASIGIVLPRDAKTQDAPWKKFPDLRGLVSIFGPMPEGADAKIKRLTHNAALSFAKRVQPASVQFRVLDESALPDHWLAHSQLDIIVVPGPVLKRMEVEQPAATKAIEKWLAAGGNLWVYATDSAPLSWVPSAALQQPSANTVLGRKVLDEKMSMNGEKNDSSPLTYQTWGIVKESQIYGYRNSSNMKRRVDVLGELRKAKHPLADIETPAQITGRLRFADYGMGTIVTISEPDPFPGSLQFWKSLVDMHPPLHLVWTERMGIDVPVGNDNYWMWLIPSVGQPPVKSFLLLNTLFALVVGPLCYFYFRRRGRLYLLYFSAPMLALLITLSLFAYALTADGVQTQVRSRQLTWIDATSGYQVHQARQTYFAVMGRESGIRFSDEVAVYPVQHSPAFQYGYYGRRRDQPGSSGEVVVVGDQRIHRGSFLPSRSQVQYLTLNVKQQTGTVAFSPKDAMASNETAYRLKHLMVRDFKGNYWVVDDLGPGEKQIVKRSDRDTLEQLLGPDVRPQLGEVPMLQRSYLPTYAGMAATGVQVSLLENRLDGWAANMPSGSFLGIAELDEQRLGVSGARVLDSTHVIMGRLPK